MSGKDSDTTPAKINKRTAAKMTAKANVEQVDRSKRRLAAASVPVLLTLANRPAMATYCGVSGRMSGNMSVTNQVTCYGDAPSYWAHNMPYNYQETKAGDMYPDLCDEETSTKTLAQVCGEDGADHMMLPNLIAAQCNLETYGEESFGISQMTLNQWCTDVGIGDISCLADLKVLNGVTPT